LGYSWIPHSNDSLEYPFAGVFDLGDDFDAPLTPEAVDAFERS